MVMRKCCGNLVHSQLYWGGVVQWVWSSLGIHDRIRTMGQEFPQQEVLLFQRFMEQNFIGKVLGEGKTNSWFPGLCRNSAKLKRNRRHCWQKLERGVKRGSLGNHCQAVQDERTRDLKRTRRFISYFCMKFHQPCEGRRNIASLTKWYCFHSSTIHSKF